MLGVLDLFALTWFVGFGVCCCRGFVCCLIGLLVVLCLLAVCLVVDCYFVLLLIVLDVGLIGVCL